MAKQPKQLTLDQAYQAAFLWLDHIGDPPVEISEPAHGSVELITERAFVRVRSSEAPVEQSSVLALLRAAESGKRLVIFSPSGYSPGALSIAETQGIALYTLDPYGSAVPETTHARAMAPAEMPDPPFAPSDEAEDDYWGGFTPSPAPAEPEPQADEATELGIQAMTTDWADCPTAEQRTSTTPDSVANVAPTCRWPHRCPTQATPPAPGAQGRRSAERSGANCAAVCAEATTSS